MTSQPCSDSDIRKAAALLKTGNLVAFPTETVYGLGADATNEQAVAAIFAAKGRPSNNPLIVHVSSLDKLFTCIDLTDHPRAQQIRTYINALAGFWPGPLSVVLPKAHHITPLVSAGGPSVAIRIPRHPVALKLLQECDRPIAAPSANPSMYISPTTAQHVRDSLGDKTAFILDGGECEVGIESTVLSLVDTIPTILRPGAVTREEIERALGCSVALQVKHNGQDYALPSPGMLAKHYAPHTKVLLRTALPADMILPAKVGAIVFRSDTALPCKPLALKVLSEHGDLSEVAASLFSALRELDAAGLDLILVDTCEPIGLGAAIMDRLLRASA